MSCVLQLSALLIVFHSVAGTVVTAAVVEVHPQASQVNMTLNVTFQTDYLTMALYSPGPEQVRCRRETMSRFKRNYVNKAYIIIY